jgi:hypothetical protein
VVRVGRTGDDLQICCSYQRNFYPIERMQKPLTAADCNRLEDALVAADFSSLDRDDARRATAFVGRLCAAGTARPTTFTGGLLTGRSAISASCSSDWPDRK